MQRVPAPNINQKNLDRGLNTKFSGFAIQAMYDVRVSMFDVFSAFRRRFVGKRLDTTLI